MGSQCVWRILTVSNLRGAPMGATGAVAESCGTSFAISPQPDVELGAGDPEEPAGLTDVAGNLLVVLDHSQPCPRFSGLLQFLRCLSHPGPPFGGAPQDTTIVRDVP